MSSTKELPLNWLPSNDKKFILELTQQAAVQILTACSLVSDREWAGVLIYRVQKDNAQLLHILVEHMCFMDIGSQADTNFDWNSFLGDTNLADYLVQHFQPVDIVNLKLGAVHSHHSMSVWHSNTDIDEIVENARHIDVYFSLVVGNDGSMVCKVGRVAQFTQGKVRGLGASHAIKSTSMECVLLSDAKVLGPVMLDEETEIRIESIQKAKAKQQKAAAAKWTSSQGYQPNQLQLELPQQDTSDILSIEDVNQYVAEALRNGEIPNADGLILYFFGEEGVGATLLVEERIAVLQQVLLLLGDSTDDDGTALLLDSVTNELNQSVYGQFSNWYND